MTHRLIARIPHTSFVWVVGTYRYKEDAYTNAKKTLIPISGKEIIYNVERF